jgi:cellulose synthase/poly-beta-1,6-N-acetylglucosamine synthase-like glycosyltransferase
VVVPRLVDSRRLAAALAAPTELTRRIRVTSLPRLQRFVAHHTAREIEHRAERALHEVRPELSARGRVLPILTLCILAILIAIGGYAAPYATLMASEIAFGALFLAWSGLRIFGLCSERMARRRRRVIRDDWLPTYSVIVPLYREAAALGDLIAALRRLDYPLEKLDIKLVVEADDRQTREALARLHLGTSFEVVIAPRSGPRTKPKALNAALPFARGSFIAIYDAEDRPEPDQLRVALEAFIAGDERLACVQARLTIDNTADSWLARLFTAEYAGLFDVFLPGLAAWRLPLPLGGSSNHFRASVLRAIGAWDPFNVTEDADLGMRLARFGYRTTVILSTTYEEAPARFRPWIRQRTRWFKGWMQTWLVHMRAPRPLLRELGWSGFAVFQLVVGGTVLAALIHSLFTAEILRKFAVAWWTDDTMPDLAGFPVAIMLGGYFVSGMLGLIGLARRQLLGNAWALLLMPAYWLLLSLAAWRALFQLSSHPHRWEKTEHGLARTSRLAAADRVQRQRPKRRTRATDSAADRRLPPRGVA